VSIAFSDRDVQRFAQWSADTNPLHVDDSFARHTHFGRRVVHGALTVLRVLRSAGDTLGPRRLRTLDIEFRNAVFIGDAYEVEAQVEGEQLIAGLRASGQLVLGVRGDLGAPAPGQDDPATPWAAAAVKQPERATPAAHELADFVSGLETTGRYAMRDLPAADAGGGLSRTQAAVLGLCSYVTGMEVPGLRSLFTRIGVRFAHDADDASELWYRARTVRFDQSFRILDTDLQVVSPDGYLVATARLRSYVPFSPVRLELDDLARRFVPAVERLRDRTALVLGGSRGLGAEITAVLALAGCRVYASARQDDDARRELFERIGSKGGQVEFLPGDASDSAWCESALRMIQERHGHLDVVVLNACAPPQALRVGPETAARREQYVGDNLRLVEVPIAAFAAALHQRGGAFVYLSSSFVDQAPAGFSHYVAVKQAGESVLRTLVREQPQLFSLVARPPVLRTRWNDTPTGVLGAIPSDWAASGIVNRLAEAWAPGQYELLSQFPPPEQVGTEDAPAPDFSLRVAASFTTDALQAPLRFWLKELELNGTVELAPYGQVLQSLLDPLSALNAKGRGFNVLLLRVRDWLRELPDERAGNIEFVRAYLQEMARELDGALRTHRRQASAETLLLVCPSHGALSSAENILVRQTETDIAAAAEAVPGLHVALASDYHARYGLNEDQIADPLRDEIAHIPYRDEYLHVLATLVARQLHRRISPIRKVVVVDCDNTLWKGVVGEVGAEGVTFDASHKALHETLGRLSGSGVLVCLCSKNEEPDVWRVFETRSHLGLRRDQVVAAMINWQPKSANLRTLAARLNLGLDSFVFIDDNPVECAEVRANCPEVLTIEWPQDPVAAEQLLQHVWEFDPGKFTREDERRTALYKEEFRRQELRAETSTFEDFVRNLQLTVDFAPLAAEDLRRAAQLTLRTNQFNFTTIRREEADLQALAGDGGHEIRTIRVRDRFGDYGLVGLVIAEKGAEAWGLDTFLLSCRVLGRGVEHRILADLGEMAATAGASRVKLRIEKTKRNTPARSFLESVVAPELRRTGEGSIECDVPAEVLAAVKFEPSVAGEMTVADDDGGGSKAVAGTDLARLRRREQQIARIAARLSTGAALKAAVEGRGAPATVAQPPVEHGAIDAVVHEAFARALGLPVGQVVSVDRLEALGCDSLRIVEITVALSEKFPWLPGTLLFEFQTVSQIVQEIVRLSMPDAARGAAVDTRAATAAAPAPQPASADIAVVGMHVRCAGAGSPDELWQLLSAGGSGVKPVPADRRHFLHPLVDGRPHWAGLVDDAGGFDAPFFGVSPREAEFMDPQLRLFLEVAWSALEDAGCVGAGHDADTGVFAGVMYGDYGALANQSLGGASSPYRCWEGFSLANRLSQVLGFGGPSLAVDTACSSSGTALHLACRALTAGDCRVAVVGGVNLILDPDRLVSLARLGILSERGTCEPFGADSDGTVLGEGAGVVILRPLDEALRRGDRIYGVIKGTGLSTGNGTVGFTAPNPQAQAEAIRKSLRAARVDPRTITYVETHGTGTALGDPIEVRGLTLGYSTPELMDAGVEVAHRCRLGSIKPNVGHLEAGAGIVGLIKVLLQMQHGMLVPSLTSPAANPQIPFNEIAFDVQRGLEPWERLVVEVNGAVETIPRRAGLSSFGVGGANAHVIVEEPPVAPAPPPAPERPLHVLALSGPSDDSLRRQAGELRDFLQSHADVEVPDVCFSVNTGRRRFERRLALTGGGRQEWIDRLGQIAIGRDPAGVIRGEAAGVQKVAFLFTGQGSQYAGMGRQLYESQPAFRHALDRCAAVLDTLLDRPLADLLFAPDSGPEAELLNQTGYTQPALFAIEYALSELWASWGIRPDLVLGHSVGELTAMCVAGGMSLDDGLRLVAARGRLMQALPAGGTMTSVMAAEDRVMQALSGQEDLVTIAAINAPGQIVISGVGTAVADISARLAADGIKTKALAVSHAFHSPLMKPMLEAYQRVVREVRFTAPRVPVVSCVDGVLTPQMTQPEYWLRQVMEPVRFTTGMRTLQEQKVTAYIEIGPRPVLLGMGRQCVSDQEADRTAWLPSIRADAANWQTLLSSAGSLYVRGAALDWKAFDQPYARRRIPVPGHPFDHKQHWLKRKDPRPRGEAPAEAAGVEAPAETYEIAWREAPPRHAAITATPARRWILLGDEGGVAAALAVVLTRDGSDAVTVRPGADELHRAWDAAADAGQLPAVVYLCGLDSPHASLTALDDAVRTSVTAALHALQVAAQRGATQPSAWIVTRGAVVARANEPSVSMAQTPLWGFARTAALEHPEIWGGIVDLAPGPGEPGEVDAIAAELLARAPDDQVAIRGSARYVPRLVRRSATTGRPSFDPAGTYLVTGGLGALGLHVAGWLVRNGARHVMLAGRRGAVDAVAASAIAGLEARGGRVTVAAADVSQPEEVEALLSAIAAGPAPLRGVVHAAGVDTRVPVIELTPDAVQAVLASKVRGGWILHERTRDLPLDLFLLFSSVASILGAAGRSHYGAANAFLDGLAAERRRQGLPALSVNWGPWGGGGMADVGQRQQFERMGNYALDAGEALAALDDLVAAHATHATVAKVDWERFRGAYEARRPRPLVSELGPAGQPPAPAADVAEWVARLSQTPANGRLALLTQLLRAEVADTLGFDTPESVPADKNLYQLGMDSLMMADLVGRLRKRLGFSASTLVFDHPVVDALASQLLDRLALSEGVATAPVSVAPDSGGSRSGIEGYSAGVDAEVIAFQKAAWPRRRADWIEPRWRWMVLQSAQRLGIDPRLWLYRDAGAVVGYTGAIPVRVKLGVEERAAAWLVDTMVLEAYRQKAVGSQIMVRAHDDMPFALSLGQTAEMREVQLRLGWKRVAPLEVAQLLIRPENVLRGKLPWPAAFAAGWGLRASSAVRDLLRERPAAEVRIVDRFDQRHDRLWESSAGSITCGVVRDASYLNWKYVDQPGQIFVRLETVEDGSVTGVAVLMFREPDHVYRYRRAFLVDLVAPLADEHRLSQLIRAASAAAASRHADALLCLHIGRRFTQALRAHGFSMRAPERYLLVDPGGLDRDAAAQVLSADNWFVTHGDSDIDRPW
jgi:FkbH-like protein